MLYARFYELENKLKDISLHSYYDKLKSNIDNSDIQKEIEGLYERYVGKLPQKNIDHRKLLEKVKWKRMIPNVDEGNIIMSDKIAESL